MNHGPQSKDDTSREYHPAPPEEHPTCPGWMWGVFHAVMQAAPRSQLGLLLLLCMILVATATARSNIPHPTSQAPRRYLEGRDVEVVPGDIVETAVRLECEDVVVSFVDTDNYSSARAALEVVQERTVVGGVIVFDHFTGVDRFRYTIGERIAGLHLLDDSRYFHLHGTGVFYRQR